nr:Xaa-Pro peptidase family protein [uncultured Cohaesibacter sp.]
MAFPREEYDWRMDKARALMNAHGVDIMLADCAELMTWLTGYAPSETMYRVVLLPKEGEPVYVLRKLDEDPCRRNNQVARIVTFEDHEEPQMAIADILRQLGMEQARIGVDFNSYSFTAYTYRRLMALLPQAVFVDLPNASDALRWIKSGREVEQLRAAAVIADKAMGAIAHEIRAGMSPRDAAAIAAQTYLLEGADTGEVGPIVRSSGGHEFLHGGLGNDRLRNGDILHVELIPKIAHYCARLMRPIVIGQPSQEMDETARMLISLQDQQIKEMKSGVAASDVDAILRQGVLQSGLRDTFPNVTAYTLGIYNRTPRSSDFSCVLLPTSDWPLETGMVFHLYASAQGLGFSETVVVTEDGGKRLTQFERRLLCSQS